ncbi:MAG: FAD-linked oxidase C-terminal domain-containing protein [Thermodesulfobacteriota bacterium]
MADLSKDSLYKDLESSLEKKISGDVYFDRISKTLYSTDAGNYQIQPVGIVVPKNYEDIALSLEIASNFGVTILPRGSGSSLAGQCVGHSLILDLSKYLNKIVELDIKEKRVRVQSGMYLENLNRELKNHGLMFGPDPSSAKIATIGGVVGNNATGAHSILYGMAGDNVESCNLYLRGGESFELSDANTSNEINSKLKLFRDNHANLIENNYPKHWRRASGYSLNYLLESEFNPAKLLAGAEGTLGLAADFTLSLVEKPNHTGLVILQFNKMFSAMEAVPKILEYSPSAIELIDKYLTDLTRSNPSFSKLLSFIDSEPEAILVVEFYGDTENEIKSKASNLKSNLIANNIKCDIQYAFSKNDQDNVWSVRRAGLGLLMSKRDEHKPIPCIEDVSVPVDQLASYTQDITELIERLGTRAGFYGHASAGCLHIRPLVNLKSNSGRELMQELTDETFKLALKYGGVMSGEHGDGLQRSYLNEKLFGSDLYGAMKELKSIFDPEGIFNPGKVVDGPAILNDLRFRENYSPPRIDTYLDWSSDNGLEGAAQMCSGQGVCRKLGEGIMCPSYMATKNEIDTTRARANILRSVFSGEFEKDSLESSEMHKVFDLCLSCKACKSECPSRVDIAKMKLEFMAHYHAENGFSIRDKLFGYSHYIGKYSSIFPSLSNALQNSSLTKFFLSKIGISTTRSLPNLTKNNFTNWFKNKSHSTANIALNKVVYFHDTWTSYYHPEIGQSAVRLLEEAGFEVILVPNRACCGRPMLSKGMINQARNLAVTNVNLLAPYAKNNIPIIGTEPSCILTFRDEYLDLLPTNEDALKISENSYMLDEFLLNLHSIDELNIEWKNEGPKVFYHEHCHQRSLINERSGVELLSHSGCMVQESKAGCCGMAGSFGYESEHYEISKQIAEDRLLPAIRRTSEDTIIAVSGVSCRHQIEDFSQKKTKHIAQVLADQIR